MFGVKIRVFYQEIPNNDIRNISSMWFVSIVYLPCPKKFCLPTYIGEVTVMKTQKNSAITPMSTPRQVFSRSVDYCNSQNIAKQKIPSGIDKWTIHVNYIRKISEYYY